MFDGDADDVAMCLQCGWPIRRGESALPLEVNCEGCGETHMPGFVHTVICAYAIVVEEPRVKTQKRRAGAMGMN
jgi:hypothetical protein